MSPASPVLAVAGAVLVAALAEPNTRAALESGMVGHMLVQIPLLALAGAWLAADLPPAVKARVAACDPKGLAGILTVLFASSYWMLPRALDAALAHGGVEAAKFVSLPLLVGLPLALSWGRLSLIGRGFIWLNGLSMLAVLGWLYAVAPVRVCNSYLAAEQALAGRLMLGLAVGLALLTAVRAFIGDAGEHRRHAPSFA